MDKKNPKPSPSLSGRLLRSLPPSAFIVLNLFFLLPYTIYLTNSREFTLPLVSYLSFLLVPALVMLVLLLAPSIFLKNKKFQFYVSLVFTLGILIWLEGTIIVWSHGAFSGKLIDWTQFKSNDIVDTVLCVVLFLAGLIFYRRLFRVAAFGAAILIVTQLAFVLFTTIKEPQIWEVKDHQTSKSELSESIFSFSKEQNIIHVVLDQLQSDIFESIISDDPSRYDRAFDGFTYFKDVSSSFPHTTMSIPAILSERIYKNDLPRYDFIDDVVNGKTVYSELKEGGYEIDLVHPVGHYNKVIDITNYYRITSPYGFSERQFALANAAMILDLVMFRAAPHYLKRYVYNDMRFLLKRLVVLPPKLRGHKEKDFRGAKNMQRAFNKFASKSFLEDFTAKMNVGRDRPLYKYIHLLESHEPVIHDANCDFVGRVVSSTRGNLKIMQRCALNTFMDFLERLKAIGVYDSSYIVVHSDHGTIYGLLGDNYSPNTFPTTFTVSSAFPVLLVKKPYSKGPIKRNYSLVELADIPATVTSFAGLKSGFKGRPVFDVKAGEERERRHYNDVKAKRSLEDNYAKRIEEYIINGPMLKPSSWSRGKVYHPPTAALNADHIDFGTRQSEPFMGNGWGKPLRIAGSGKKFHLNLMSAPSVFLSLSDETDLLLTVKIGLGIGLTPVRQPLVMTLKIDGNIVGTTDLYNVGQIREYVFRISRDMKRNAISEIEFSFSEKNRPGAGIAPGIVAFEFLSVETYRDSEHRSGK